MAKRIERPIKAWVTKYALTNGILVRNGTHLTTEDETEYFYEGPLFARWNIDAFATEEKAIDRANDMRLRKIESLKKQIRKLEALKFKIVG